MPASTPLLSAGTSPDPRRGVAVFGSSDPAEVGPLYESARRIGGLIARAGGTVVCGGYGGVMEAASRGAREAGGEAIGVTIRGFADRQPNRWLTRIVEEADLFDRTRRLMSLASAFIILAGRSGTLAEVSFLWALRRAGQAPARPIVLYGPSWIRLYEALKAGEFLEAALQRETIVAESEADAVAAAMTEIR